MADVQIAVIDQQNTEVTIAVPGVQGPVGATGDVAIAQDGTAALPGIRFENDTNTGIYSPGADQVAISTNGTGRLFVDSSGRVGVGTSSVTTSATQTNRSTASIAAGLALQNSSGVLGGLIGLGAAGAGGGSDNLYLGGTSNLIFAAGGSEKGRIDSSGRLGLGTSSPVDRLHVEGRIAVTTDSSTPTTGEAFFYKSSIGAVMSGFGASIETGGAGSRQTRLSIDSSGNVGIGTTSPSELLHVNGNAIVEDRLLLQRLQSSDNLSVLTFSDTLTGSKGNNLSIGNPGGYDVLFHTGGVEKARIDSSGRLLVGTSSTSGNITNQDKLAVVITGNDAQGGLSVTNYAGTSATIGSNACLRLQRSNGVTDGSFTALSASAWGLGRIEFNGSNGSGFGTGATIEGIADAAAWSSGDHPARLVFSTTADGASSPTEAVRVTSSQDLMLAQSGSGIFVGTTTDGAYRIGKSSFAVSTGTLYIGNAAIQVSSDVRLKENIEDTSLDALDAISKIAVKDFTWNDPTDTSYNNRNARGKWTGLIAQELVDVLSFVVNAPRKEEDGSIDHESESLWTLDQSQLCPVLIKAIQQQQEIIVSLEARLSALEAQ
jgi:hypothetical protein